ncbi:MAG: pitrilysin family protein [Bacteroidota bacterium]|nr:pitrilysin family protein [Bacteroidota bacterium]
MIINQYRKTLLPSGIKVVSETIPYVKSFSLGFWFNVGSRDENLKNNGITHFIEHMLFKGTKKRSPKKIAEDIEGYGGYLNAFTSKEHTCYYGRGLSQHIGRTFDVLADMIQEPAFKPSEIKKEAGVIVDELYDIEDDPEDLIFDKFEECLFGGNSLGMPVIGSEKNIKSFNQSDLFDFIGQKYGFNTLTIAASGAVEHEELLRLTEKYITRDLGKKKIGRKSVKPKVLSELTVEKDIQQVHAILGTDTYGYKDKKRAIVNVLSHILGEGSSSRLFQTVREKNGICYQLNSFLNSFYDVSSFGVYFSTNDKLFEKSISLIQKEFKKLRDKKVSDKELKKAKEYLKGSMLLSLESLTQRMSRMAQSEIYFNRIETVEETIKDIDSVTAEQVLEKANLVLDEKALSKVIIRANNC